MVTPTLFDVIEEAIVSVHGDRVRQTVDTGAMAAAVLDAPELQAIRGALWRLATIIALEASDTDIRTDLMKRLNLPQPVIAWVLS